LEGKLEALQILAHLIISLNSCLRPFIELRKKEALIDKLSAPTATLHEALQWANDSLYELMPKAAQKKIKKPPKQAKQKKSEEKKNLKDYNGADGDLVIRFHAKHRSMGAVARIPVDTTFDDTLNQFLELMGDGDIGANLHLYKVRGAAKLENMYHKVKLIFQIIIK